MKQKGIYDQNRGKVTFVLWAKKLSINVKGGGAWSCGNAGGVLLD